MALQKGLFPQSVLDKSGPNVVELRGSSRLRAELCRNISGEGQSIARPYDTVACT